MARSKSSPNSSSKKPKRDTPRKGGPTDPLVILVRCAIGGIFLLLLLVSWMLTSSNHGEIYTYTQPEPIVEKPKPTRMLGAIVPHETAAWFFKLTGPDKSVEKLVGKFENLIESLKFDDSERPTWTLPKSWKQLPSDAPQNRGMFPRFATLQIPGDRKPLEVSVTTLQFAQDEEMQNYLLKNINRWRGQLRLGGLEVSQLQDETKTIDLDGTTATLVNLVGVTGGSGGRMSPHGQGGPFAMQPPPRETAEPDDSAPKFEVPDGWKESKGSVISISAYQVSDDTGSIEITVTPLKPSGTFENVNRWRGQVGLGAIDEDEFNRQVKKLSLGDVTGDYVEIVGDEKTILGVLARHENTAWAIKLIGNSELAEREKAHFEQFVESFRF